MIAYFCIAQLFYIFWLLSTVYDSDNAVFAQVVCWMPLRYFLKTLDKDKLGIALYKTNAGINTLKYILHHQ